MIRDNDRWVRLKTADFICSNSSEEGKIAFITKTIGDLNYLAPEVLQVLDQDQVQANKLLVPQRTNASDVFALGCTFYKFLTKGHHPFGQGFRIAPNILENIDFALLTRSLRVNREKIGGILRKRLDQVIPETDLKFWKKYHSTRTVFVILNITI